MRFAKKAIVLPIPIAKPANNMGPKTIQTSRIKISFYRAVTPYSCASLRVPSAFMPPLYGQTTVFRVYTDRKSGIKIPFVIGK